MSNIRGNEQTDGLILKDEDGRRITFNGSENFGKFLRDVKDCLIRNGHGGVLSEDADEEPLRPDGAFARREGLLGYGLLQPNDDRAIEYYLKASRDFKRHCEIALAALKMSLGNNVKQFLELTVEDMRNATKTNILMIIDTLVNKYGGWTATKGQRNYFQMIAIPRFTSIETVQSGLLILKDLITERQDWGLATELLPDSHYRQWLLLRINGWNQLDFLRNTIEADVTLTFADCKRMLLAKMDTERERLLLEAPHQQEWNLAQNVKMSSVHATGFVTSNSVPTDSSMDSLYGNIVELMKQVQSTTHGRSVTTKGNWTKRGCFNCGVIGHSARYCTAPWCFRCQSTWKNVYQPDYHNNTVCPQSNNNNSLPTLQKSQLGKRPYQNERQGYEQTRGKPSLQRVEQRWPPVGQGPVTNVPMMQPKRVTANSSIYQEDTEEAESLPDINFSDPVQVQALASALRDHLEERTEDETQCHNPEDEMWDPDLRS